ncbi:MAG: hypothetical protein IPJ30_06905 [Acidobacteria bacterium]|nr:hypothetical protein [Acidobacteriota bacterium]MBK8151105.1 hypothetical protein [Acidobacteriota bacterium]
MFLRSRFVRISTTLGLILSIALLSFGDTIRLKDGSIIKGRIVSFAEGKFTVQIGEGSRQRQMVFFADEVESIEFDGTTGISTLKTQLPSRTNSNTATPDATPKPSPTPNRSVIITDNTTQPTPTPTPVFSPVPTPTPLPTPSSTPVVSKIKPVVLSVKVLADNTANGWTNSQWVVKKGQKIRISAKGQINLGNGRFSGPAGISSLPDKDKLVPTSATGGLIAVIGDDNNEFLFIGASREFVAPRDGALFLGVNEGDLNDNSGAFDVTVEIEVN